MGFVYEPYLQFTPDMTAFFARIIAMGFSFGEAAYASQQALSWQTTVIGDPLYRPYRKPPGQLHRELELSNDARLQWSHLRIVNLNFVTAFPIENLIGHLLQTPLTASSAVLQEKLGWLYQLQSKSSEQILAWNGALNSNPSPLQKVRLLLGLADLFEQLNRPADAEKTLGKLVAEVPDYPGMGPLKQRILRLKTGVE